MAITSLDLKYRQSERMTDFADGGGRMSATEIVDNQMNNVFADRSDLDGILGRVSLRKMFLQVDTANTDTLLGAYSFLTDPPADPLVSVCIFDTESATDERTQARNYIESYRIRGVKSPYTLYGDHFPGQQTIQVYCRPETASPDIGDVLMLSTEQSGYPEDQQFVAVREVASRQTVTFTDTGGDFVRDVLILQLTTALQFDFHGREDPSRYDVNNRPPTLVRYTQVADSAKYYGQKPCTVAPEIGDLVIEIGNPYIPIVPSTQAETPLVDQLAGLGSRAFVECGASGALTFSASLTGAAGVEVTRFLGSSYAPGTLNITVGSVALRDDGNGGVVAVDPGNTGWSGVADYATGAFSIARDVGFSGSTSVTATPAGAIVQQAYSRAIGITPANRQLTYVMQIPGQAAPGTVVLDFLALGKWIRLRDSGRGQLAGNAGEGSGTINYTTGSIAVTLGALPDVDSALLLSWGVDTRARNSSGEITVPTPAFRQVLDHPGVQPGTLEITWTSGAASKSATAAADGTITGDATGAIDHTAGVVEFTTSAIPDPGEQFHYAYNFFAPGDILSEVFTPTPAGHAVSFSLAQPPAEDSVVAQWQISAPGENGGQGYRRLYTVRDNGSGGFTGAITGTNTIDYGTGAVVLTVD